MAYGYIQGDLIDENNPEKKLINSVIESIRICFDNTTDDSVRLQIIKSYLTAVTSPVCDVHENSLMVAVRTCYNVYLITKNEVNRTTAKATLTQMLNSIFQRMEKQNLVSVHLKKMVTKKIMQDILENVNKQVNINKEEIKEEVQSETNEEDKENLERKRSLKKPKLSKKQM